MNVYCVKVYRGSKLIYIKYVSSLDTQHAIYEVRGDLDLDVVPHVYYDVKQVD